MTSFIKAKYEYYRAISGDIEEHLPTLWELATQCDTVTEIGVRKLVATWSFLYANPKKLTCIDIVHPDQYGPEGQQNFIMAVQSAKEAGIDFEFILGNDLVIDIPESDLIFIDTDHTYEQLSKELTRFGNKANKFLIFHDTNVESMTVAIYEFMSDNPSWILLEKLDNNNGLIVLKRNHG